MADDNPAPIARSRQEAKLCGAKRYFNGNPCPHGHVDGRYTCSGSCCECVRLKAVANVYRWRALQDPAVLRKKAADRARRWRAANPEAAKEKDRRNRTNGRLKIKLRIRSWRQRNAERVMAYDAAWKLANPEMFRQKCQARWHRRRAREKGAKGSFGPEDIRSMLVEQGGRCAGCGCDIRKRYEVDHKTPLARGGSNDRGNLHLLCRSCNARKHTKTMDEWSHQCPQQLPKRRS